MTTWARTDCSWAAEPHQYRPAWVSGTPLDRPVVPPVYSSSAARSVPDRLAMGPGSPEGDLVEVEDRDSRRRL